LRSGSRSGVVAAAVFALLTLKLEQDGHRALHVLVVGVEQLLEAIPDERAELITQILLWL